MTDHSIVNRIADGRPEGSDADGWDDAVSSRGLATSARELACFGTAGPNRTAKRCGPRLLVQIVRRRARICGIAIHTLRTDDRWRDELPVLTGTLVSLREVAFEDVPSLHVLIASDPKVTAHISPPPHSIYALQGFVAWAHRQRAAGKFLCYAVVPHGLQHAVGLFQIRKLQPNFFAAEWGFVLGSSFWSTGMFEDAAVLVADFAFDTLGVDRLEARAVTTNVRANGALNKIGAKGEVAVALAGREFRISRVHAAAPTCTGADSTSCVRRSTPHRGVRHGPPA